MRRHKTYKHKYPYGEDEPDDKLYPHSGSVDFSVLTAVKLSEAAQGPEPELELEPEPESESESESELESCLPLSLQREIDADRARSIEMLRNLADTLDQVLCLSVCVLIRGNRSTETAAERTGAPKTAAQKWSS